MLNLKTIPVSTKIISVLFAIVLVLLLFSLSFSSKSSNINIQAQNQPQITTEIKKESVILAITETDQLVLLDSKTNAVKEIFSKELSMAILALQTNKIQRDFNKVTK